MYPYYAKVDTNHPCMLFGKVVDYMAPRHLQQLDAAAYLCVARCACSGDARRHRTRKQWMHDGELLGALQGSAYEMSGTKDML